jgi:nucleoside-diphosphate-sugar epimerase
LGVTKIKNMHPNRIINEDLETIIKADIDWQRFNNKTILITGANGFLPAYMVETLYFLIDNSIVDNLKIFALVRNKEKAEKRFSHLLNDFRFQLTVQDVCSPVTLLEPIHFIVHAASQASPKYYGVDPVGTLKANVVGTINLCELSRNNPIESFLYFSSGEIYGETNSEHISETEYGYLDPVNVRSCYGESKRMGENICVSYMHQYGIPVKIVRPAHTYGPGMDLNDGRVFADFVCDIVNDRDIIMKSDGSTSRAFCYLSDATSAFFKVLLGGKNGEAYNIANPLCNITILELAHKLVSLFPEKHLKVIKQERTDKNYIVSKNIHHSLNIKKVQSLNWNPITGIEDGFYKTILNYKLGINYMY